MSQLGHVLANSAQKQTINLMILLLLFPWGGEEIKFVFMHRTPRLLIQVAQKSHEGDKVIYPHS